jgi:hypothetical protein
VGARPIRSRISWRRCNRYTSLVKIDGAADFWQPGADAGTTAPDFIGNAPGLCFHTNDSRIPVELRSYFESHFRVYFVQPGADPDFSTPGSEPHRHTIVSMTAAADVYAWLAEQAQNLVRRRLSAPSRGKRRLSPKTGKPRPK